MLSAKLYLFIASISGLLAVALGAFGAHGLKSKVAPELLAAYQTGVQYHFTHTLVILGLAIWMLSSAEVSRWAGWSANMMLVGILLFSGSLYAMALLSMGAGFPKWLGPITPLGGLSFMIGWGLLAVAAVKLK